MLFRSPDSTENLKKEIENRFNISTVIAKLDEVIEIDGSKEKNYIDKHIEVDLSKSLNDSIYQVKELFNVYDSQRKSDVDDEFASKHYSEYNEALLDIKNRLMELMMLENK